MASGITNSKAASSHREMEPGPACAAAGSQRVPTMQLMAQGVISRRPSSRRSVCSAGPGSGMHFEANAAQAFLEKLRLATEPEAKIALEAEVRAGYDQYAVLFADALGKLIAGRQRVVLHQAKRARFG